MVNMANPMPPITPKIFISHAWEDKTIVRRLEAELQTAGAEVWVDHSGVRGGDNLPKRISEALAWCDTVLLIWSEAASKSHWVELEWTNALSLRKTIIPCLVSQVQLPALLANVLYVDCRDFADGFKQLRKALHLESPSAEQPSSKKPEPTPASAIKERRIDAAVPSAAEVGRTIDLRVQVRFPNSPRLGLEDWPVKIKPAHLEQAAENVALEFPVDAATGKLGSARLEIHVVAPDFDIAGQPRQLLLVPPDAPSKCLSFLITPKRTGVCRLNVEVYNLEHIFLGAIPIETEVGGNDKLQSTNVANLFLFVVVGKERTATRTIELDDTVEKLPSPVAAPRAQPMPSPVTPKPKVTPPQATRDDTVYSEAPPKSLSCLPRAALWLGLLASLVTVLAFIFEVPQKLLMQSRDSQEKPSAVIMDLAGISDVKVLQEKLIEYRSSFRITFGSKEDFEPPDDCYVFVVDESRVLGVYKFENNLFYGLKSEEKLSDLSERFAGKAAIWVQDLAVFRK